MSYMDMILPEVSMARLDFTLAFKDLFVFLSEIYPGQYWEAQFDKRRRVFVCSVDEYEHKAVRFDPEDWAKCTILRNCRICKKINVSEEIQYDINRIYHLIRTRGDIDFQSMHLLFQFGV